MEYALLVGRMSESLGSNIKMGLNSIYDKLFENPLLLALVCGGVLLLGLWALKSSR
jgi:hypothetical protein